MITNKMELPVDVAAYGWVPFVVIIVSTLIFSWFYIKHFQSLYNKDYSSLVTSVLALSISLFTILLVPVDVFIVSFMKTSNGDFKDWANNSDARVSYENTVKYGYFTLYGIMILFMFFIVPFVYFYYEENDEETQSSHICVACRYTIFFILIVGVLLLLGAVIPFKDSPNSTNSTTWDKIEFLFNELGNNKGEDALSFVLSVLSLIGMLLFMIYTGYGMAALPCSWIKGSRKLSEEHEECLGRKIMVEAKINAIKDKYRNGRLMKSSDRRELEALEESEHLIERQVRFIENESNSLFNKCVVIIRPFQIIIGILLALIGLLVFLSLLLTSIDKAMHSLGYAMGFALRQPTLPNPVDIMFVWAQKVFPLDYILFFGIIIFFIFCSLSGITRLGIWFLWIRIFRIRPHKTRPQGLLLLCVTLMFIILALNVVLYTLTPQYTMYGSQHYKNTTTEEVLSCNTLASSDECILTRMSSLLLRFFYKAWFFGASYYVGIWIFLAVVLISSVICIIRKPASPIAAAVTADDFEESDEELLAA